MGDQAPQPRIFTRLLIILFASLIVAIGFKPLRPKAHRYWNKVESQLSPYLQWRPPPVKGERGRSAGLEQSEKEAVEARGALERPAVKPKYGEQKKLDEIENKDRNALDRILNHL